MAGVGGLRYDRLRQLMQKERPRRVLALLTKTNILCSAAVWDLPVHLVVSERNDPRRQQLDHLWDHLRRVFYRRADVVTANTEGVLEALQDMGPWKRLDLLPNPLPGGLSLQDSPPSPVHRQQEVLAVARLVPQKGLDVLIRAFASLPPSVREGWRVTLVGDGPERQALEALASDAGLRKSIRFEGFRSDPLVFMRRASIFALPSRFEGMPNALLEAMAAGLPSVVSDASPGPLEMVTDGRQGLVVPCDDVSAFATALQQLMRDGDLRDRYGDAARAKLRSLDWGCGGTPLAFGVGVAGAAMNRLVSGRSDGRERVLVLAPTARAASETFIRANLNGLSLALTAYFGDELTAECAMATGLWQFDPAQQVVHPSPLAATRRVAGSLRGLGLDPSPSTGCGDGGVWF